MITIERLQELIDKKEKIYYMQQNDINGVWIPLENVSIEENTYKELVLRNSGIGWYLGCPQSYSINSLPLQDLYETKEEAEFTKEFKNITRIETLNLPTFEELKKFERFDFKAKDGHRYTIHFISGFNTLAITGIIKNEYYGEATKENYFEACRIAKNLFLGVKEDD